MQEMKGHQHDIQKFQATTQGSEAIPTGQNTTESCPLLSDLETGAVVLTEDEISGLLYMIEEEKMAMDLYDAFAEQTGGLIFDRISDSELRHMNSLIRLAEAADIDLSEVSSEAGVFSNPLIQELYDTLLAQGSASLADAIDVGILVEETDIMDLQQHDANVASVELLGLVYDHLATGSEHHLAAFTQYDV